MASTSSSPQEGAATQATPRKASGDPVTTAGDRRAAIEEEYGKYVATEQILGPAGDVLIFNTGDPVPVSFVEDDAYPWLSKDDARVATRDSKAGRNAQRRAAGLEEE